MSRTDLDESGRLPDSDSAPLLPPREQLEIVQDAAAHGYLDQPPRRKMDTLRPRKLMPIYVWLLPSWTHTWIGYEPLPDVHRSTDYLDGMRGVAALFVVFFHFLIYQHTAAITFRGYGRFQNAILSMPFIRIVHSGPAMVSVFFIISGYVLTARCIVAMRSKDPDKVYDIITSATFRRFFRLLLPSLVGSGLALALSIAGLHEMHAKEVLNLDRWTPRAELTLYCRFVKTTLFNFWDWRDPIIRAVQVPNYFKDYSDQLWTIAREYNCSMVLFAVVAALSQFNTATRVAIECTLVTVLMAQFRWDVALFIAGMVLAELCYIVDGRTKSQNVQQPILGSAEKRPRFRLAHFLRQFALWSSLLVGWFLTGVARDDFPDIHETPAYSWLVVNWGAERQDKFRFWLSLGTILMAGAIAFSPLMQRAFTTRFARYLGKTSYSLYIVHHCVQGAVQPFLKPYFPVTRYQGLWDPLSLNFFITLAVHLFSSFWVADVFWRGVDIPATTFGKWLEGKCFAQPKA